MYTVDERDRVVELDSVPQPDVGAPEPFVLSDEYCILLVYYTRNRPGGSGDHLALIQFNSYESLMFGAPNDEAFSGHPLESRGLHPYGVFQIENSSWIRQLERMNSVHPYHSPESFKRYKHFIFASHDSTFECVAKSFEVSEHNGDRAALLPVMQSRFRL